MKKEIEKLLEVIDNLSKEKSAATLKEWKKKLVSEIEIIESENEDLRGLVKECEGALNVASQQLSEMRTTIRTLGRMING